MRARLLLLKQDRLSLLEKQLEKIDLEESAELFLEAAGAIAMQNEILFSQILILL